MSTTTKYYNLKSFSVVDLFGEHIKLIVTDAEEGSHDLTDTTFTFVDHNNREMVICYPEQLTSNYQDKELLEKYKELKDGYLKLFDSIKRVQRILNMTIAEDKIHSVPNPSNPVDDLYLGLFNSNSKGRNYEC